MHLYSHRPDENECDVANSVPLGRRSRRAHSEVDPAAGTPAADNSEGPAPRGKRERDGGGQLLRPALEALGGRR